MSRPFQLPRTRPEREGVPPSAIHAFLDEIEKNKLQIHSFMVLRHGSVVAEGWYRPYEPEELHVLHSLSKSFTSTAIGLLIEEGKLDLDAKVVDFYPEKVPATPDTRLEKITVRNLLTMASGQQEVNMRPEPEDWVASIFTYEFVNEPGAKFNYQSTATYLLSAILQKITGETLLDYLEPRLFAPLGITNKHWASCPKGINTGGWGLSLATESIAKFGQLYLNRGVWEGKQLVPAAWIDFATSKQIETEGEPETNDWAHGYGFQFWRCRHDAFRGDGAFGQNCIVIPHLDVVIATTSGEEDLQAILNAVWNLTSKFQDQPVDEDSSDLDDRLRQLCLNARQLNITAARQAKVNGVQYDGEGITFRLEFDAGGVVFLWEEEGEQRRLEAGTNAWRISYAQFDGSPKHRIAAHAGWISESKYQIKVCDLCSPRSTHFEFEFKGAECAFALDRYAAFEGREGPRYKTTAQTPEAPKPS